MNERKVIAAALVVIAATMVVNTLADTERSADAQMVAGPVEPTVVAGQMFRDIGGNGTDTAFRFWSDGAIDRIDIEYPNGVHSCKFNVRCGGVLPIHPGSCPSDVTRNGDVDFPDLLGVLSDWGPCPEKP